MGLTYGKSLQYIITSAIIILYYIIIIAVVDNDYNYEFKRDHQQQQFQRHLNYAAIPFQVVIQTNRPQLASLLICEDEPTQKRLGPIIC